MKNGVLFCIFMIIMQPIFAQSGSVYGNGNGEILETIIINKTEYVVRKHEAYNIKIGRYPYIDVYDNFDKSRGKKIFEVYENDIVSSTEVAVSKDNHFWLKIIKNGRTGWIESTLPIDPYIDNNWAIIEKITFNNRSITIRKLEQTVQISRRMNVRDQPGLTGNVLFQLEQWTTLKVLAVTEETETIDNNTSHWIRIQDEQARIGWVFGGYASVERGGPALLIPEEIIRVDISLP